MFPISYLCEGPGAGASVVETPKRERRPVILPILIYFFFFKVGCSGVCVTKGPHGKGGVVWRGAWLSVEGGLTVLSFLAGSFPPSNPNLKTEAERFYFLINGMQKLTSPQGQL